MADTKRRSRWHKATRQFLTAGDPLIVRQDADDAAAKAEKKRIEGARIVRLVQESERYMRMRAEQGYGV